jgi:hypothetical protein
MVCYARPASRMAAVLLVVFLVFGRSVGHFLDSAALYVAIALSVGGAALAAAVACTVFLSVRRRRAAAGGCVSCQLRCQHAMTEQPRRLPLVSMVDRSAPARAALPVVLGVPAVPPRAAGPSGPAAPRWPDRPAMHAGAPPRPAARRPVTGRPAAAARPVLAVRPAGVAHVPAPRPGGVPHVPAPRTPVHERAGSAVLSGRRGQDAGGELLAA